MLKPCSNPFFTLLCLLSLACSSCSSKVDNVSSDASNDTAPSSDAGTTSADEGSTSLEDGITSFDMDAVAGDTSTPPSDLGTALSDTSQTINDVLAPTDDTQETLEDGSEPEGADMAIAPPDPIAKQSCQDYTLCDTECQSNAVCNQQCDADFPVGKTMVAAFSQCLINACGTPSSPSFSGCSKQAKWNECIGEYNACYGGTLGCIPIRDCTLACGTWQCQNECIWSGALSSQFTFTSLMECIGNNCNQSCGQGNASVCDSCVSQYCGTLRDECMTDVHN